MERTNMPLKDSTVVKTQKLKGVWGDWQKEYMYLTWLGLSVGYCGTTFTKAANPMGFFWLSFS